MATAAWQATTVTTDDGRRVPGIAPVIVSASRATDIPAHFATWFRNRLRAGYVRWTNPFNANQVQYVSFQNTRVIVFWSKNPRPLIPYLPELDAMGINYYFQFTLNDYEPEGLEPNVPPLGQRVETFKALADKLGARRVVWRYDPLLLANGVTVDILLERIARLAGMLRGYTEKLVVSFADIGIYKRVPNNLSRQNVTYHEFTPELMETIAAGLSVLNRKWGLNIATCAESIDLSHFDISHNRCIDDGLMIDQFGDDPALMDFLGCKPDLVTGSSRPYLKDKAQRKACGCVASKDIGAYNTCRHHCTYCYANASRKAVEANLERHNPDSDALVSRPQ